MKRFLFVSMLLLVFATGKIFGQRFAVATGNWNSTATWSTTSGGAAGASVPTATDAVTIQPGVTVTVNINNGVCASLAIGNASSGTAVVVFTAGSQVTVSGTATVGGSQSNGTLTMTAGGTLICNAFAQGSQTRTFTYGTGTIVLNGTSTLPSSSSFGTFYNLTVNGTTTMARNLAINGTLTQTANITGSTYTLTINGTHIANSNTVSGTGGYTLASGASFSTSMATGVNGNILSSGTKTFNTNNNFTFNGSIAQVTGAMMPVTINNLTINNAAGVTLTQSTTLGASGILNLQNGVLTTTAAIIPSVTNNAIGAVTGGSTTSFVNGPLKRTLALSANYTFPVGKGGVYLPFGINPSAGTAPIIQIEAFNANSGGSADASLGGISNTEYWQGTIAGGTYSDGSVSLTRQAALGAYNTIARCGTVNGSYSSLGGSVSGNSVNNSTSTGNTLDYFVLGIGLQQYAVVSGNWNDAIWATTSTGVAGSAPVPVSAMTAVINGGVTVTVNINNAVCANLQLNEGSGTSMAALQFNNGSQLTVSSILTFGSNSGPGTVDMTNGGTLLSGSMTTSGSGVNVFTPGSGSVLLTAVNTIPSFITGFNNLTINGTTTLGGSLNIAGTLIQNAGIALGANGLTINGTHDAKSFTVGGTGSYTLGSGASFSTSIATGVNGNLTTSGTKTFNTNNNFSFNGAVAQVTGTLMPAGINNLTINNTAGVTLSQATTLGSSGVLSFLNGILTTTVTNILSLTNTSPSAITGFSTLKYINGPLRWSLETIGNTYIFPLGKGGNYYPFTMINPAGVNPVVTVEAFNTGCGGIPVSPLSALSTTEYWSASFTGTFSGASISLAVPSLGLSNAISRGATQGGTYSSLFGTVSGNSVINSDNTGSALGYFALGVIPPQRFAVISGNWSGAIWASTPTGVAGSASTPTTAEAAYINGGVTVTADINNAVCYALNLNEGSGTSTATLVFNAGSQLTSLYGVTLGNSTSDGPGVIDMTSGGTLSCGGLAVSGAGASQFIPGSGKVILTASSALPSSIVIGFRDLTINAATTLSTSISVSGILTQTAGIVIPTGLTLTLATGSTHIAAAQTVSGAGNYSLSAGALFTTTLATGINGNMTITGTLTLTPGADFTFNGSTAQVTGLMMPVLVRNLTVNNTAGVTLSQATAISSDGSLNLQSGALTTTATNLLSVTNTSSSAITGMSTTNFVKGPLSWSLATTGLTYVFPVGKGSNYYPFTLINPTGTDPVVTCEAFNTSAAGTATAPLSALSTTEYWATSFTGTFTGGTVSLSRAIAIGTMNVIGRCLTAANGSYSSMGGTVSGTTIINSNNTGASLGWFLYATTQSTAITLSNPDSPVTAANVCALSQKVPIHAFKIGTNGNTGSGTLTNFAFTTTGTYLAVHIVNFKIWYSPTNTLGSATLLGTNASPNTAGSQNFPAFTCAIPAGSTYYFWITMDVNANVVNGATIAVSASTSSNMTSTLTRSGSASASGTQTFRAPTVPNAGPDQTVCSSTATLAGNTISAGTGTWSLVSGTAAITTPSSPTSQVTNLGMGDNVLRWTADNLGCTQSDDVKISRWTTPANPGAISGPTQISHSTPGLVYSVSPVMYATSYLWTFPAGWIITAGSGTASVTVTSGNVGQDGSITVQASNLCGNSSSSALAVSITQPHTGCNQCHNTVHNTFGWTLTGTIGNSNLCMSCHNPSGAAQNKPFYNAMKAVPGVSGNSHNWDVPAVNAQYETSLPTNTEILNRLPSGNIVCSTCHNQHNPYSAGYLRIPNTNDDLCKQCHSARVKGLYASNPNNKGSHPVDITYDVNNPSLNSSPSLPLVNGKVSCSTCHDVHYSASNDGNLKRIADENTLCQNCHVSNVSTTMNHQGMSCTTCHYAHSTGSNNIMLVRDVIATPNSGPKAVAFTSNLTASDFATGSGQFSGVCEACHTLTDHYSNTSGGTSDARHNPSPQPCISCHTHKNGFYPQTNCLDCHNTITDKPGVGPVGGRRQIVDNSGDGLGTGGDFKRLSHHVSGSVPNTTDCIKCHYMGDHMKGTVELLDPDAGYNTIITYNPADHTSLDNFCKNCHDANGAGGDMTPFSDNVTVPFVDPSMWNNSGHKNKPLGCVDCHDNGHGSNKHKMLAPYNKIADVSPDPLDDEEEFCLNCHKASGLASTDIQTEFGRTHTHQVNEVPQYGVNSGIECISCHNPHQNNNTYPLSDPDNNKILWTQTVNGTRDFCLRCHDGAPPAGISFPTTFQGTGYNKSKYVNSRHDQVLNNGEQNFVGGGEDCLSCHDRHGTNGTPETNKTGLYTMLKGTFDKSGSATANACNPWVSTGADYGLCFKCHQTSLVSSSSAFGNYHSTHVNDRQTPCIICHDAHGPYDAGEAGLIDFTYGTSALAGTDVNKGSYTLTNMFVKNTSSTGNCYLNCHTTSSGFSGCGTQGHSPENYSGTGLTYPWTYSWPY